MQLGLLLYDDLQEAINPERFHAQHSSSFGAVKAAFRRLSDNLACAAVVIHTV